MSNPEPQREGSVVTTTTNNDTLITIAASQPAGTVIVPAITNTSEPTEELSVSTGSQRSLNSRLFPFRFSRDILINNVSSLPLVYL